MNMYMWKPKVTKYVHQKILNSSIKISINDDNTINQWWLWRCSISASQQGYVALPANSQQPAVHSCPGFNSFKNSRHSGPYAFFCTQRKHMFASVTLGLLMNKTLKIIIALLRRFWWQQTGLTSWTLPCRSTEPSKWSSHCWQKN